MLTLSNMTQKVIDLLRDGMDSFENSFGGDALSRIKPSIFL